jgi:toxin ParE1/3/4
VPVANTSLHPEAQEENEGYEDAIIWYHLRSPMASLRFEAEVERVISAIEGDPERFARYGKLTRYALLRRFPYSIVYQLWADHIYILAVAHGSRLPGYWRNRL